MRVDVWGLFFVYLLVLLDFLGTLLVGTDVGVFDKQFWKIFWKLFMKKFYVYCKNLQKKGLKVSLLMRSLR